MTDAPAQVGFGPALAALQAGNYIARASWPAPNAVYWKLFAGTDDSAPMIVEVTPAVDGGRAELQEASGTILVTDLLAGDWIVTQAPAP